jgi:hypothetical protein
MKNQILFFALVFIIISAIGFASANPLDVTFSQNPFPSHAGDQIVLNFYVSNAGSTNLTDIKFTLDVDDPINLRSSAEKTVSLQAGETKTLAYNAYIQDDAKDGKEQITLDYSVNGTSYSDDFDVQIAPDRVYLQIKDVQTIPNSVAPGEKLTLRMTLENSAETDIKNVIVRLNLENLPFAPSSVTEQQIDLLQGSDSSNVQFELIALSSAEIVTYKVPVEITYFDEFNTEYSREDFISIEVYEKPNVDAIISKDTLVMGMPSKLNINILNKGLGKISFAEVTLLPGGYTIEGPDSQYIGTIESDDYGSVEFTIVPKQKNSIIQITLEYRDSNNKKYSEVKVLNARAYSVQEAQRLGLLPGFPWLAILIVLVIIAVIVFFVIRRNKKKKKLLQG